MKKSKISFNCLLVASILHAETANAVTVVGTETVLNKTFGVNLHMDNCCKGGYSDTALVTSRLQYIGARRLRDWATTDKIVDEWAKINKATGAKFHVSIPQTSPQKQRNSLARMERWMKAYPKLIDVIEGSNEPDTAYPKSQGASLEDSAYLQTSVYKVGQTAGVKVTQLSIGGGWVPPFYEGNYKKFGKPPADYGNSHAYMNANEPPAKNLYRVGKLASYSVDGKAVDTTEFGIYQRSKQDLKLTSDYMIQAPFDAYLQGMAGLFVYALHDDISGVVSFYDKDGNKRPFADYWHYTTQMLADPTGKYLPAKNLNIQFLNMKATGQSPLGIKNLPMYKSDGSLWIVTYDSEKSGANLASQTIVFDKVYKAVKIFDSRTGALLKSYSATKKINMTLSPNQVYLIKAV